MQPSKKKPAKKLSVSRETVRDLSKTELARVVGGFQTMSGVSLQCG